MTTLPPGWGRSLGMLTELALHVPGSCFEDRGDHLVVSTPAEPAYWWGNFLAFRGPPGPGDAEAWPRAFAAAFGANPLVRHMAFGWDDPTGTPGAVAAFTGFAPELSVVLTATHPIAPRPTPGLVVRPLATDAEWEAALVSQVASRAGGGSIEEYTAFKRRRLEHFRAMQAAGRGAWYGAFLGDELLGELGLYAVPRPDGEVLGRYQSVGTRPEHRGRGVCGTLVAAAAAQAREALGIERFVIVAEEGSAGDRVYRSTGFEMTERFAGLCREPGQAKER